MMYDDAGRYSIIGKVHYWRVSCTVLQYYIDVQVRSYISAGTWAGTSLYRLPSYRPLGLYSIIPY